MWFSIGVRDSVCACVANGHVVVCYVDVVFRASNTHTLKQLLRLFGKPHKSRTENLFAQKQPEFRGFSFCHPVNRGRSLHSIHHFACKLEIFNQIEFFCVNRKQKKSSWEFSSNPSCFMRQNDTHLICCVFALRFCCFCWHFQSMFKLIMIFAEHRKFSIALLTTEDDDNKWKKSHAKRFFVDFF